MIFNLNKNNPYDREKFRNKVEEFLEKGEVVTLTRRAPQRTLAQSRYMYLLLGFFGSEYGLSVEEAKAQIFKELVNPEIFVRTKVNKFGFQVKYLRSTAELTTAELTTAIDRFRFWSLNSVGLYLPSPDDKAFLLHCEQAIEANKEFL